MKHRSRVARDPGQPNLRQVHLVHAELLAELRASGFSVAPGAMGENVTTSGVDLLGLPTGARLRLGAEAVIEVTGLRNPCAQLDGFHEGLMAAVLGRDAEGNLVRKAGIMAVGIRGGEGPPGDRIGVELPPPPHPPLGPLDRRGHGHQVVRPTCDRAGGLGRGRDDQGRGDEWREQEEGGSTHGAAILAETPDRR